MNEESNVMDLKKPKDDEELEELLRKLGRNTEQIEAIKDFGKLSKVLDNPKELDNLIDNLKVKWRIK